MPHSHRLRDNRRMEAPGTWFITKSLWPKKPVLTVGDIASLIVDALVHRSTCGLIQLAAFVVMPDHWHALFAISVGNEGHAATLPGVMHGLDTWIGSRSRAGLSAEGTEWEDGYHDTRIRSSRQFRFVLEYIEANPVERGLVTASEEWVWSSANPEHAEVLIRPWPWSFEQDT